MISQPPSVPQAEISLVDLKTIENIIKNYSPEMRQQLFDQILPLINQKTIKTILSKYDTASPEEQQFYRNLIFNYTSIQGQIYEYFSQIFQVWENVPKSGQTYSLKKTDQETKAYFSALEQDLVKFQNALLNPKSKKPDQKYATLYDRLERVKIEITILSNMNKTELPAPNVVRFFETIQDVLYQIGAPSANHVLHAVPIEIEPVTRSFVKHVGNIYRPVQKESFTSELDLEIRIYGHLFSAANLKNEEYSEKIPQPDGKEKEHRSNPVVEYLFQKLTADAPSYFQKYCPADLHIPKLIELLIRLETIFLDQTNLVKLKTSQRAGILNEAKTILKEFLDLKPPTNNLSLITPITSILNSITDLDEEIIAQLMDDTDPQSFKNLVNTTFSPYVHFVLLKQILSILQILHEDQTADGITTKFLAKSSRAYYLSKIRENINRFIRLPFHSCVSYAQLKDQWTERYSAIARIKKMHDFMKDSKNHLAFNQGFRYQRPVEKTEPYSPTKILSILLPEDRPKEEVLTKARIASLLEQIAKIILTYPKWRL